MSPRKVEIAFKSVSSLFKTLAHPDRLRLVGLLQRGELGVNQLQQMMGVSQSVVSQHLKRLKLQGLVAERKEGTHVFYCLKNKKLITLIIDAADLQTEKMTRTKQEKTVLLAEMQSQFSPTQIHYD